MYFLLLAGGSKFELLDRSIDGVRRERMSTATNIIEVTLQQNAWVAVKHAMNSLPTTAIQSSSTGEIHSRRTKVMMKSITNTVGVLLCIVAIIGFLNNGAMGMNLNPMHDVLLLVAGAAALYFGIQGTEFDARNCCRVLGVVFALVGVIGIFSGGGMVTLHDLAGRHASHLIRLIPGHLEMGTADSVFNLIIGAVSLIAGFLPRETEIRVDMAAQKTKEKVSSGR